MRFARDGSRAGVELTKDREYRVTVDGGPWQPFRAPWDQDELDGLVEVLRNTDPEARPTIELTEGLGRTLGVALSEVPALVERLSARASGRLVVFWQLDYPELARIPWELACWWAPPHHHILLDPDVSFVRTVPLYDPRSRTSWPTGAGGDPRVLFVWGETPGALVPHADHRAALERCCDELDAALAIREVASASDLVTAQEAGPFDFVHVLAHGVRTDAGEWGLRLADENVTGAQVARALVASGSAPAMVTLAACDSANESDASFGSVAYELHAHGVPMVVGSQFRLRKRVSTTALAELYDGILRGEHPLRIQSRLRRQLAPDNNESWSNEVLYTTFPLGELDAGAAAAKQQAALRRARAIERRHGTGEADAEKTIAEMVGLVDSLRELADTGFDPPETHGLLGSMVRRIAYMRADDPDPEELRDARDHYEAGFRADANSVYCGVNALHLSVVIGDRPRVDELLPVVRFVADNCVDRDPGDYWALASAGEVAVYAGATSLAADRYRRFVRAERDAVADAETRAHELDAAVRQLRYVLRALATGRVDDDATAGIVNAAESAITILDSARLRVPSGG